MKNLLICLLTVGLFNISTAQTNGSVPEIKLENVTIRPLNINYLKKVHDAQTPEFARELENKAARYDVTESPIFDREFEAYEVVFDATKNGGTDGVIIATYDQNGKILNSIERYKNIALPKLIRDACLKEFPDYTIHKDFYLVSYNYEDDAAKKIYKVQLRNDNGRKNLKVDALGNIL